MSWRRHGVCLEDFRWKRAKVRDTVRTYGKPVCARKEEEEEEGQVERS